MKAFCKKLSGVLKTIFGYGCRPMVTFRQINIITIKLHCAFIISKECNTGNIKIVHFVIRNIKRINSQVLQYTLPLSKAFCVENNIFITIFN